MNLPPFLVAVLWSLLAAVLVGIGFTVADSEWAGEAAFVTFILGLLYFLTVGARKH